MSSGHTLRLFCPAKLNLGLRVLGRRADGYHLLDTVMHAIDLGDELYARPVAGGAGPTLAVSADDPRDALPPDDDNLVLRAARAWGSRAGAAVRLAFALHKRVPHGGGLGGGSSDAAAALRLCNAFAEALGAVPLDLAALHDLARGLGADVPFFLRGGTQRGRGIGDELEPVADPPARWFTLLVPPFGCPTVAVYKNLASPWQATFDTASMREFRDSHHNDFARNRFVNDLTAAAERVRPELAQLRRRAGDLGVAVAMTGSGSVLFATAADEGEARTHRERLAPFCGEGVRLLAARSAPGAFAPVQAEWPTAAGGGS
ncbi:MAG: 4-(cytidine 5'-diphospho)-2-C-methyl-D-erythritol kinase [Planctomycetota bacterium]